MLFLDFELNINKLYFEMMFRLLALILILFVNLCSAQCPIGCDCPDGSTCTSCITNFYFMSGTCSVCNYACSGCRGLSSTDCIDCNVGFYINLSQSFFGNRACVMTCPNNYHPDSATQTCVCNYYSFLI